jgi:hypothetical protein
MTTEFKIDTDLLNFNEDSVNSHLEVYSLGKIFTLSITDAESEESLTGDPVQMTLDDAKKLANFINFVISQNDV